MPARSSGVPQRAAGSWSDGHRESPLPQSHKHGERASRARPSEHDEEPSLARLSSDGRFLKETVVDRATLQQSRVKRTPVWNTQP